MNNSLFWRKRIVIERAIREYFWSLNYEETRTPMLVMSPGMEPHIRPIQVAPGVFLPTSPEFAMKKLLASGMKKIFQICSSFRDEPFSPEHSPEFTMLEFYEAEITLDRFQERVEKLFSFVSDKIHGSNYFEFRGKQISLKSPWPRFQVNQLFQTFAGLDLRKCTQADMLFVCKTNQVIANDTDSWDDLYFKIWLNLIEPKLPTDRPCFITHYPVSQSSLCNRVKDETGFEWANRFEIYLGQLELGNAFDELRDSRVQRANFERDQKIRRDIYGKAYPESPMDEELLAAIEKMPPTCGIAIGLDRMAMLLLDAASIHDTIPLPTFWPQTGEKR